MKKSLTLALICLIFLGGMATSLAQGDTVNITEEPKDTISVDSMVPIYYEEDAPKESTNTITYAIVGVVVIGGATIFFMRKKKK